MKLGFYFNSKHLKEWSWEDFENGQLPLSGTDNLNLYLPLALARVGLDISFFSTGLGGQVERLKQFQVQNLSEAAELAKAQQLDLLWFSNTGLDETEDGVKTCDRLGQPCIVSDGNGPSEYFADLVKDSPEVRRVVCWSATQADLLRDHKVFKKTEFVYHPLLQRLDGSPITRDPRAICYLGSLTESKGFHHLAKAWPLIHAAVPDAKLMVLGSGRLYQRGMELGPLGVAADDFERRKLIPHLGGTRAAAAGLGVRFLGLASPRVVQQTLAQSAVCVVNPNCTTNFETFCVSAIEASEAGTAVVGANRGGLRETIVHKKTGIRINSETDLAPTLIHLLKYPDLTVTLGAEGRRWVRQAFAAEKILTQWQSLFERVLNDQPANPPNFSWGRADTKIVLKEMIRQSNRLLGANRLPTLHRMKARIQPNIIG